MAASEQARRLAQLLAPSGTAQSVFPGVVSGIASNGDVSVQFRGADVGPQPRLDGPGLSVGDVVAVARTGPLSLLVLGRIVGVAQQDEGDAA